MSWHLPHHYRLNTVHHAVSMALLYSVGAVALPSMVQAATVGKTVITSAQHEPLAASIMVTDINAADFSASLAGSMIYQEMGLTPTDSMSVRFVPADDTSGHVLLSTIKPVVMPFTDVVLTLNDSGQRNIIPKTLLMPLSNQVAVGSSEQMISAQSALNIPTTDLSMASAEAVQPLMVMRTTPPPLFATPTMQAAQAASSASTVPTALRIGTRLPVIQTSVMPALPTTQSSNSVPELVAAVTSNKVTRATTSENSIDSHATINSSDSAQVIHTQDNTLVVAKQKNAKQSNTMSKAPLTNMTDTLNNHLDTLNIQVTRRIEAQNINGADHSHEPLMVVKRHTNQNNNTDTPQVLLVSDQAVPQLKPSSASDRVQAAVSPSDASSPIASKHYTVQRHESLWSVSQQIAEQNNLNTQKVMKDIRTNNPTAFISQQSNRLKALATLDLSHYETVPSQHDLHAAITAKRQQSLQSVKATAHTSTQTDTSHIPSTPLQPESRTLVSSETTVKIQPVTVSKEADATIIQTSDALSTDMLADLEDARLRTAAQAKRLKSAHSAFAIQTKTLQLQNQKSVELRARLKELRN